MFINLKNVYNTIDVRKNVRYNYIRGDIMNTITLIIIELLLCIIIQTILYKRYKTEGLYAYTVIALIISSIMSLKTITIYNFDVNKTNN